MAVDDNDAAAKLLRATAALEVQLDKLNNGNSAQMVRLSERAVSNKKYIRVLTSILVVMGLMVVALGWGFTEIDANNDETKRITERLDRSAVVTRQNAFCPLYTILLEAVHTPGARNAAPSPERFDKNVKIIEEGYAALECDNLRNPGPPVLGSS